MFPTVADNSFTACDDTEQNNSCQLRFEVTSKLDSKLAHHNAILTNLDLGVESGI
jgi:hypothetical protein